MKLILIAITTLILVTLPMGVCLCIDDRRAALPRQRRRRLRHSHRAHVPDDGVILRPRRVVRERLAPLRGKLRPGHAPFDIQAFREQLHNSSISAPIVSEGVEDGGN